MISSLIDKFKGLWYEEPKKEVEGYVIMTDITTNKTLLLIKDGEKTWKTKWYDDNQTKYQAPNESLASIFNSQK